MMCLSEDPFNLSVFILIWVYAVQGQIQDFWKEVHIYEAVGFALLIWSHLSEYPTEMK